ncbi:hypothetical protein FRC17_007589, partial [Serendipita sp. 399]
MLSEFKDYTSLRGNRTPIPTEREAIQHEIASNEELLKVLKGQKTLRLQRHHSNVENLEKKKKLLPQAKFRLRAATTALDALNFSAARLDSTRDGIESELASMTLDDTEDQLSSQLLGVSAILDNQLSASLWITSCVERLREDVRVAVEAVSLIQEEVLAAQAMERYTWAMVQLLQKQVTELEEANAVLRGSFRAIHRVPQDIWRYIFSDVTDDALQTLLDSRGELWAYKGAPFRLSGVCRNWRAIAMDHHLLWRHIFMSTSRFSDSDAELISLSLSRQSGPSDRELIVRGNGPMPPGQIEYFKSTFAAPVEMKRVTIFTTHKSKYYALSMANQLSTSKEVAIHSSELRTIMVYGNHNLFSGVTSLFLNSCLIAGNFAGSLPLQLTSLVLHNPPDAEPMPFHALFCGSYPTLQYLSINANLEPGSLSYNGNNHILPSLTTLEGPFSQLNLDIFAFYSLPALRNIKLLDCEEAAGALDQWMHWVQTGGSAWIESVSFRTDHWTSLLPNVTASLVLHDLPLVVHLQLQGSGTDSFLRGINDALANMPP